MQTFLEIGLSNVVMAFALALVAASVGVFCRRPAVRHTLWLLVLLKLVTPPVMPIPVTFPAALDAVLQEGKVARLSGVERGHDLPNPGEEELILQNSDLSPAALEAFLHLPGNDQDVVGLISTPASGLAIASFIPFVFAVWLTGAVLWFALAGIRIRRFQRLLRYGKAASPALQDETCLLAERLGLVRCPTVWLLPGRVSPLLWALGRRVHLVLPVDLLDRLGPEQRASLLAHELAHARRRDHWVRWLEFVVSGLYWWLPVAWWARHQLQQAEEECCDAWVVWTLPALAKAYAKALLQTVDFLDARPALPPVASGIGHVHLLKRRLTMIVRQPLCPCLPWPVHLAVVVLGLLFLSFAPQRLVAQSSDEKPASELSIEAALALAEQDSESRETERRLRNLEEKMDRLMKKLDALSGEKFGGKPSGADRFAPAEEKAKAAEWKAKVAEEKARFKQKEKAEKASEKAKTDQLKEFKWRFNFDGKDMSPEQIDQLKKQIQEKVSKAVDPERLKEIQKRVQEAVEKGVMPAERMEEIQRRVNEAMKKSTQELNAALKRSTEQLERAKSSLQEGKKPPPAAPRREKFGDQDQHDLERRMDRLEQKMDRVLEALEKPGKPAK